MNHYIRFLFMNFLNDTHFYCGPKAWIKFYYEITVEIGQSNEKNGNFLLTNSNNNNIGYSYSYRRSSNRSSALATTSTNVVNICIHFCTKSAPFSTKLYPSVLQKNIEYSCKAHRQSHRLSYLHAQELIQAKQKHSNIFRMAKLKSCSVDIWFAIVFVLGLLRKRVPVCVCGCVCKCAMNILRISCLRIEFWLCILFKLLLYMEYTKTAHKTFEIEIFMDFKRVLVLLVKLKE